MITLKMVIFLSLVAQPLSGFAGIDASGCDKSLKDFRSPNVSCSVVMNLDKLEQESIIKTTSGVVNNLSCSATIQANKADVVKSLSSPIAKVSNVSITCDIKFNDGDVKTAKFNISPEFHFLDNEVSKATLNVGEVEGIGFLGKIIKNQLSSDAFNKKLKASANDAINKLKY